MDENKGRNEIHTKAVRAGKRTYFFDVKATRSDEYYLTITESKKKFSNDLGKFVYEKHKLFLYKEDFDKFIDGLQETIDFIKNSKNYVPPVEKNDNSFSEVEFEDLNGPSDQK